MPTTKRKHAPPPATVTGEKRKQIKPPAKNNFSLDIMAQKKEKTKVPFSFEFINEKFKTQFTKCANKNFMSVTQRLHFLMSEDLKQNNLLPDGI